MRYLVTRTYTGSKLDSYDKTELRRIFLQNKHFGRKAKCQNKLIA